jgi:CheY-like chemotaxis protein
VINLNAKIVESQKILGRLISEDIEFAFNAGPDLWNVKIDPSQLDQILMNLSANAGDAMPEGGWLSFQTANVRIDVDHSFICPEAVRGEYVQLTVSDTGHGMDRETMTHAFEPFFTTKEVGKGTGLGLATVYGIVAQNGGFINLYSELGQGTVFKIYLPRYQAEAETVSQKCALPVRGSGTILVVEDEEMLLRTATHLLEEIGYTVIKADSPFLALSICEDPGQQIDMVLTDVVMPGMNGKEMTERMKATRPELKTLFMSGYPAEIVTSRGIVQEGMYYIRKPLDFDQLREKICQLMG